MTSHSGSSRNRGMLEALRRRNVELEAMVELGKALTATLDLSEVLTAVMTSVRQLMRASTWSLLLADEQSGDLIFEVVVSPAADRLKGRRLPAGHGVAGWVATHGEALLIPDVQLDTRFSAGFDLETAFSTQSIICVPLRSADRILGVIELINPQDKGFGDGDLQLLATIADFAAIAVENARNYQRIRQLVITDDLTGLYNARHMNRLIEIEVERASRYGKDLSLVFIDLDFFKRINDTRGHLAGSQILAEFGEYLHNSIRKIDFAARYGGDEFVLILPETPQSGALTLCNNLLERLRAFPFLGSEGQPPVHITASLGIATYPLNASNKEELIAKADQAMYLVKGSSRNAVRCA